MIRHMAISRMLLAIVAMAAPLEAKDTTMNGSLAAVDRIVEEVRMHGHLGRSAVEPMLGTMLAPGDATGSFAIWEAPHVRAGPLTLAV